MSEAIFDNLAIVGLALTVLPLLLGLLNLCLYRTANSWPPAGTAVSVLIPARNEASNIGGAVSAALANTGVELEIIVLDDGSTDETPAIVTAIAQHDRRVRLYEAPPLPAGWAGKTHACQALSRLARYPILLFIDADVRLAPDAVRRIAGFLTSRPVALVSGFPRQETVSLGEVLTVPLIHFLAIGFLPIALMRWWRLPGLGAGCGQLLAVERDAYRTAGGHAGIAASWHDGLTLPRAFRRAGFSTDLFDASDLAHCRMYHGWRDTWHGFGKNACEGMATPLALPLWTFLLGGGHVLPWLLLSWAVFWQPPASALTMPVLAMFAAIGFRLLLAWRFRQRLLSAILHPVGVAIFLALQWSALIREWRGRRVAWRGRVQPCTH